MIRKRLATLKRRLAAASDEKRIEILMELTELLLDTLPEQAERYARQGLELNTKLNNPTGQARTYLYLGIIYQRKSQLTTALEFYQQALSIFKKTDDTEAISKILDKMTIIYGTQGNFHEALDCLQRNLELNKTDRDPLRLGAIYAKFGNVYNGLGQSDRALDYLFKSLEIYEQINDPLLIAGILNNIGIVYCRIDETAKAIGYLQKTRAIYQTSGNPLSLANTLINLGRAWFQANEFDKSLATHQEALALSREIGNQLLIMKSLHNVGVCYVHFQEMDKAEASITESLRLREELGDVGGQALAHINLGNIRMRQENFKDADAHLQRGINLARQMNLKETEMEGLRLWSESYELTGQFDRALELFKEYTKTRYDVFNETKSRQIAEMQTRYETEKKELKIQKLEMELSNQKKELRLMAQSLIQKNEFIHRLQQDVGRITQDDPVQWMLSYHKETSHLKQDWDMFKTRFDQIYPNFIPALTCACPEMTRQELRICALVKIGLRTKDIAKALFISPKSVSNHRNHARTKLGIPLGQSLVNALAQY